MKNRAKCKKCNSIIESFHRTDYQTCVCNEISVYGGPDLMQCGAVEWSNFVRVDDLGNEINVKVKEDVKDSMKNESLLEKYQLKSYLSDSILHIDNLPTSVQNQFITFVEVRNIYSMLLTLLSFIDDEN